MNIRRDIYVPIMKYQDRFETYWYIGATGEQSCGMVMLSFGETCNVEKGTKLRERLHNSPFWTSNNPLMRD